MPVEELEPRRLLSGLPQPAHVVVVIEENRSYGDIIGYSGAPYINSLAQQGALFTQSFGEHMSGVWLIFDQQHAHRDLETLRS